VDFVAKRAIDLESSFVFKAVHVNLLGEIIELVLEIACIEV
jgi:hypothetical protein